MIFVSFYKNAIIWHKCPVSDMLKDLDEYYFGISQSPSSMKHCNYQRKRLSQGYTIKNHRFCFKKMIRNWLIDRGKIIILEIGRFMYGFYENDGVQKCFINLNSIEASELRFLIKIDSHVQHKTCCGCGESQGFVIINE